MRYAVLGIIILGVIHNISAESVVCNADGQQLFPRVIKGPGNGAYICFADNRAATNGCYEVSVQKVDISLNRLWDQGKPVSDSDQNVSSWVGHRLSGDIVISPVGSDTGVIAVWINNTSFTNHPQGIYARRISNNGTLGWGAARTITTASANPFSSVPDGAGGVICAWMEQGVGYYKVMVKRLNSNGDTTFPGWGSRSIDSGSYRLGNPRLAVTGNYIVAAFDSIEAPSSGWDSLGGSTFLVLTKVDISTGTIANQTSIYLASNSDPEPNTYPPKYPWFYDCLDNPLAVYNDTLYVCEWGAKRVRNNGCDAYYHADTLRIRLWKLPVTQNGFGNPSSTEIETVAFILSSGRVGTPIENFRIRAPVITALANGGAVVVYSEANGDFDFLEEVDSRNWKLKIKFVIDNTLESIDMPGDYAHTPDVLPTDDGGCIITYASYATDAVVKTIKVNSSGQEWGPVEDDPLPYNLFTQARSIRPRSLYCCLGMRHISKCPRLEYLCPAGKHS
jgi:hypothetical protein